MKNAKFILAPIALSLMVSTVSAKDVETGYFIQADAGQAKGYEKSSDLRNEVLSFGDVGVVSPLSQKRRAWKVSSGYRFNNHFALALSYADLGVTELGTSTANTAINVADSLSGGATALSAIFNFPLSEAVNMHAKLGYSHLSARANRTPFGHGLEAGSNNDIVYGGGMSFDLDENLSLMLDWERYKFERTTDLLTAGLRYTFGEVATAKAKPAPIAVPVPVAKPAPVVAPKPVVKPMPEPKPAPIVELKPLNVNVFFANNSSVLDRDAKMLLDQAKSELNNDRLAMINVEGTASASGNVEYNQMLSMRRASVVSDYIKANWNVDSDKVNIGASGEDDAQTTDTSTDRKVTVKVKFN